MRHYPYRRTVVPNFTEMNRILLIAFMIFILFTLCGRDSGKNEADHIEPDTLSQGKISVIKDSSHEADSIFNPITIENFVDYVLKDKKRSHRFEPDDTTAPSHLTIFSTNGIKSITAYSDKRYPKTIEPSYYEHFILFVLEYQDQRHAGEAFKKLIRDSELMTQDLDSLDHSEQDRLEFLYGQSKPGGMILQKNQLIVSLVETCRNTPIGGTWTEYEDLLLSYILNDGEEITVLNADCGKLKYNKEERLKLGTTRVQNP